MTARVPIPVIRMFVFGVLSVAASVYAVVRYYTRPHPPMIVEVPVDAGDDAGEIPAPEVEQVDF